MSSTTTMKEKKIRRQRRIRVKLRASARTPRLTVFRSNHWTEAQLIDDAKSHTLIGLNDRKLPDTTSTAQTVPEEYSLSKRLKSAYLLGFAIAQYALKNGVTNIQFDRSGYRYHGRVRAVAEGARAGGLTF